jgi:hypothetical protein
VEYENKEHYFWNSVAVLCLSLKIVKDTVAALGVPSHGTPLDPPLFWLDNIFNPEISVV